MDLNASPLPEDDEQQPYNNNNLYEEEETEEVQEQPYSNSRSVFIQEERAESAVATMRREREERRRKMRREQGEQGGAKRFAQTVPYESRPQNRPAVRNREVPQGWLDCPAFGQPIDKLIPSKVPLDETYNNSVLPGKRYSSKQLITKQRKAGREIGLVLDLTNTTRYYSVQEWTKLGIKHQKIACRGRDSVPDNESVNQFVFAVMEFMERHKNSKNQKYILVHCTHGHNRTGFMIVHYLMRTQLTSVSEAIHRFASARPPGIYKPDYITSLYKFYHEVPESLVCPPTPDWKRSSELDLNGEAVQDDDGEEDSPHSSAVLQENAEGIEITNDDVLGDAIPSHQQEMLRNLCYKLLEMHVRGNGQFPGSHPVSLNKDNLQLLKQRYYYTTWKADGTRYMMLIMRDGCYLVDRTFSFRRIQMRFPIRNSIDGFHEMTLIDGEMIIDKVENVGLKRRYLAYDLMAINGVSKVKLPFSERWKLLEDEIIKPRNYENNPTYKYDMELFRVRRKGFWLLSTVEKLLHDFIPKLSHESDGLIFQGWDDPYVCRTHEGLLKWKFPEMNSVDFLFEIGSSNQQILFISERGKHKPLDGERVKFPDTEDVSALAGKIIECSKDPIDDCWVCMRVRYDKNTANDINTYRKVLRSIKDNITQDVLVGEIKEIVRLPMYQDRTPHHPPHRRRLIN